MTNRLSRCLIVAICVGILSACTSTPVRLNEEVNLADIDLTRGEKISAKAAGFHLFLVIPIMVNSRQARAWERLKQYAGSDYISDVTITERWTYGWVGTSYTTIIEATAYPRIQKTKLQPMAPQRRG
jgi:hypothetical protein